MNIFITGGCGYKGTVLVPKLLKKGFKITVVDLQWFGNHLPSHKNLKIIKQDIRNLTNLSLKGFDAVIHLASIANDPCGDLDPIMTWEISALSTMQLADKAYREGVKQFIYASSASVYGIKKEEQVVEDMDLHPLTVYNSSKMVAERALLSYSKKMCCQIIRPATVCGFSPRMRLDVVVNLLTAQAITKGKITVLGGNQDRPNIHIDDITDLYCFLIDNPKIEGVFNAGGENLSVKKIAEIVGARTNAKITYKTSNDSRSYRLNSDKLSAIGFTPKKSVEDSINEVISAFEKGLIEDESINYNVEWMRHYVLAPISSRGYQEAPGS